MTCDGKLKGCVALVTGGSRGIGFGIAREFARNGADLMLVATNVERLEATRVELATFGGNVEILAADVGERAACQGAVHAALDRFGRLEILVNSAAAYKAASFLQYDPEDFERLLKVNLHGPIHLMQAALPHMVERGYGRIINVASTAGKWASANQSAYNVSKHGLVGLTRCTAMEFAAKGVTVNAICPGMVQTDLAEQFLAEHAAINNSTPDVIRAELIKRIPERRFLDISECGHLAVYLASREAQGMTGQSILLDGGMLYV
jgi:NAD(P)-dependent dehydrogenase (short-subunit alcohol dehydrogenase family)